MDLSFGDIVLSTIWFMLVFAWIWLMISILTDLFRDPSVSGWGKAVWTVFLIVLPWIGALTYLIARGRSMNERSAQRARQQEEQVRQYVREVAGTSGAPSPADDLGRLADLRQRGVLSATEYERARAALAGANGRTVRQPT